MNNKKYYHVTFLSGAAETGAYIADSRPMFLPAILGPVSSFNNIEDNSLLTGLSWIDMPNEGYWEEIPSTPPNVEYYEYLIADSDFVFESGCITTTYEVGTLNDEDIIAKVSGWKDEIRVTRDKYLQLTDFTQLPDIPISTGMKEEYKVFREELREMFDGIGPSGTGLVWPDMPTGATNIDLPPLPPIPPLT